MLIASHRSFLVIFYSSHGSRAVREPGIRIKEPIHFSSNKEVAEVSFDKQSRTRNMYSRLL